MPEIFNKYRLLKLTNGKLTIFDYIRKKYVVLTPEETVRQNLIDFLVFQKHYPKSLIKLESGVTYNSMQKRSDILVFDRSGNPFLLIECKAPAVQIDEKVIKQASIYNSIVKAPYLGVSNGSQTYCFEMDYPKAHFNQIADIPNFKPH